MHRLPGHRGPFLSRRSAPACRLSAPACRGSDRYARSALFSALRLTSPLRAAASAAGDGVVAGTNGNTRLRSRPPAQHMRVDWSCSSAHGEPHLSLRQQHETSSSSELCCCQPSNASGVSSSALLFSKWLCGARSHQAATRRSSRTTANCLAHACAKQYGTREARALTRRRCALPYSS